MSLSDVKVYYVVEKNEFNKYLDTKLEMESTKLEPPKRLSAKIQKFLKLLASCNIRWNTLGYVTNSSKLPKGLNVFHNSAYVVTGEGEEPEQITCFLKLLLSTKAFEKLLKNVCKKVKKKLHCLRKLTTSKRRKKQDEKKDDTKEKEETSPVRESSPTGMDESDG